jgi:hypothetical protein
MRYISILLAAIVAACATVYESEDFQSYQQQHDEVAVLPFTVSIDQKGLPKDMPRDLMQQSATEEGYLIQQQLVTQYMARSQGGAYTVSFQPADETNVLLTRAGITVDNIARYTKSEIAEVLGVDAVISGTLKRSKPMGTGAAVASTFLVGFGATNKVVVNMNIHDGQTGSLIWSYDHQQNGGIASSPDRLSKNLIKNSASKFPYKRDA